MKTANSAAVLQRAQQFAREENSVAGEAAKEFADTLAGYIRRKQYNSGDFDDDSISFLTIAPEQLNEMDDEVVARFLENCRRKNALGVMKRFCQICISSWFDISVEKLSLIASVVAKADLKAEGAMLFHRASEKLSEEAK